MRSLFGRIGKLVWKKRIWKNRKISLRTKIRILEATVMTVVKYGAEAWAFSREITYRLFWSPK